MLAEERWTRRFSRRQLLSLTLLGTTSLVASTAVAQIGIPWIANTSPAPRGFEGKRFLTADERSCVDALVSRLIPSDELGPGAREAGVVDFIDDQLAGSYGRGERWYMQGPFGQGLETQGYQSEHAPAALYRASIAALDAHCRGQFDGRRFADLSQSEQDDLLHQMKDETLELEGVSAGTFFALLLDNAIEGFFCDPVHGGNRDMIGWRLVGFPGARYDYRDYLDHNGERISIEPVGLMGRAAWTVD